MTLKLQWILAAGLGGMLGQQSSIPRLDCNPNVELRYVTTGGGWRKRWQVAAWFKQITGSELEQLRWGCRVTPAHLPWWRRTGLVKGPGVHPGCSGSLGESLVTASAAFHVNPFKLRTYSRHGYLWRPAPRLERNVEKITLRLMLSIHRSPIDRKSTRLNSSHL